MDQVVANDHEDCMITIRSIVMVCMLWLMVVMAVLRTSKTIDESFMPIPTTLRINPNYAERWELTVLPRIGDSKAWAMIDYRNAYFKDDNLSHPVQAFSEAIDLQNIRGIGPKTSSRLKPYLRFDH